MKIMYKPTLLLFSLLICLFSFSQNKKKTTPYKGKTLWEIRPDAIETHDINEMFKLDTSRATKQKTMAWIKDKLSLYLKEEYSIYIENTNYDGYNPNSEKYFSRDESIKSKEVSFNGDNLLIEIEKSVLYGGTRRETYNDSYTIPISNLKNVSFIKSSIIFETFDKTIKKNDKLSNYESFEFDSRKETNINRRLKLAFVHLVKFYYKSTSNEAF